MKKYTKQYMSYKIDDKRYGKKDDNIYDKRKKETEHKTDEK